jgi:putative colanic acid biosynthesis acetyltransferase WcaF
MNENIVELNNYRKGPYKPGNIIIRTLWYCVNRMFFKTSIPYPSFLKVLILKLFGCKIGSCIIKPDVNIKYPWFLNIGYNVWIGESVWIDNLAQVKIGNNVCISQGSLLLTGNHDFTKSEFDLIVKEISIEDGVWIGAKVLVCPGAILHSHCVISAGSVLNGEAQQYMIYKGNPCIAIKKRNISCKCRSD